MSRVLEPATPLLAPGLLAAPGVIPYADEAALAGVLQERLAPMELALSLEYLYAHHSMLRPDEIDARSWPQLPSIVAEIRRRLLMVSISEMAHLRWVNQMLWEMSDEGLIPRFQPVLTPCPQIPRPAEYDGDAPAGERPHALRPLSRVVLDDFIAVERPSGFIDGAYARVVETLKQARYPRGLRELATRIDTDGIDHYMRFREAREQLRPYPEIAWLRPLRLGSPRDCEAALQIYRQLLDELRAGFIASGEQRWRQAGKRQFDARAAMSTLNLEAERLAAAGIGIDYHEAHR